MFNAWQSLIQENYRISPDILWAENKETYIDEVVRKVLRDIDMNMNYSLEIIQRIMLTNLNYAWKNHVDHLVELKKGIELRAKGGIKPIDAYRQESYKIFKSMWDNYYEALGDMLFRKVI